MIRRLVTASTALAALVAVSAPTGASTSGTAEDRGTPPYGAGTAGPPYAYATELMGDGSTLISLPDQAMITRTEHGYLYRAGQQDSHLVVTMTDEGLRFEDAGTDRFKRLARACRPREVATGVAAVCRVPAGLTAAAPLLVEVWPRLGDDFLDASSLPATFALTMLSDAGHDVAHFGAGPDFFNGFTGRDQVWGGGGNDWIRTGQEADLVEGGAGDDQIVGTDGADRLSGDDGRDLVGGGAGDDRLVGGAGADAVRCEAGADEAWTDGDDRMRGCETVHQG